MRNKQLLTLMSELQQLGKNLKSKSKQTDGVDLEGLLRKIVQFTRLPITPAYLLLVYFTNNPRNGKGVALPKVLGKMTERFKVHTVENGLEYLVMRGWAEVRTNIDHDITETLLVSTAVEAALEEMDERFLPSLDILDHQRDLRLLLCKATTLRRNPINNGGWSNYVSNLHSKNAVPFVQHAVAQGLDTEDLSMALLITGLYINDHNAVNLQPVINTLNSNRIRALKAKRAMASGDHPIIKQSIIERSNSFYDEHSFKPTDAFLSVCLSDSSYETPNMKYTSCTRIKSGDIPFKTLIYENATDSFIRDIQAILNSDYYDVDKSKRSYVGAITGFNVIISGPPGTGKTELVLQMAFQSGRDIIEVDVTGLRDKFYGETEKLLKGVFDEYQKDCSQTARKPILLFNEADSLFGRRTENLSNNTSKIENTIQTILLNQLEKHEGILIVTTNLPDSMDAAYSRRFVFDVEVQMPSESVRLQHLQNSFPELEHEVMISLAKDFTFSPALLENFKAQHAMFQEVLKDLGDLETKLREFLTRTVSKSIRQIGFSSN